MKVLKLKNDAELHGEMFEGFSVGTEVFDTFEEMMTKKKEFLAKHDIYCIHVKASIQKSSGKVITGSMVKVTFKKTDQGFVATIERNCDTELYFDIWCKKFKVMLKSFLLKLNYDYRDRIDKGRQAAISKLTYYMNVDEMIQDLAGKVKNIKPAQLTEDKDLEKYFVQLYEKLIPTVQAPIFQSKD